MFAKVAEVENVILSARTLKSPVELHHKLYQYSVLSDTQAFVIVAFERLDTVFKAFTHVEKVILSVLSVLFELAVSHQR